MKSRQFKNILRSFLIFCILILSEGGICNETSSAINKLNKVTEELDRFQDSNVAVAEGYIHYDGYDSFSMGEHWFNKAIYKSGTCNRSEPSHLQYLVIEGKRTLIGTGYVCTPEKYASEKEKMFDNNIIWHTHGPAYCLLPNGSAEDYRDLSNSLPNKVSSIDWQTICRQEGGTPEKQKIRMLHTWNWIPSPNGRFAHENFSIPFIRVGLPVPDRKFLDSDLGAKILSILKLAHGDTHWWYWRGFKIINTNELQRQKGWSILQKARTSGQIIQGEMVEIGDLQNPKINKLVKRGEITIEDMHKQLADVFTKDQMKILNKYIASLQTHEHHEHDH